MQAVNQQANLTAQQMIQNAVLEERVAGLKQAAQVAADNAKRETNFAMLAMRGETAAACSQQAVQSQAGIYQQQLQMSKGSAYVAIQYDAANPLAGNLDPMEPAFPQLPGMQQMGLLQAPPAMGLLQAPAEQGACGQVPPAPQAPGPGASAQFGTMQAPYPTQPMQYGSMPPAAYAGQAPPAAQAPGPGAPAQFGIMQAPYPSQPMQQYASMPAAHAGQAPPAAQQAPGPGVPPAAQGGWHPLPPAPQGGPPIGWPHAPNGPHAGAGAAYSHPPSHS